MRKLINILLVIIFFPFFVVAQSNDSEAVREIRNVYTGEAFRALSVHADIFSPIMGIITNKDIKTFELQTDINLYDKFFPTIEAGFGSISTALKNGQTYNSSSPFFRIGINYNLLNNATVDGTPKVIHSYPFLGLRYGFGAFNYKMNNIPLNDGYWGIDKRYDFESNGVYGGWFEIVGGIRVDIYRGITMGWSVRLKTAFHSPDKAKLWWTPGYGFTSSGQFSFNYTVGYTFRTRSEIERANRKEDKK